MGTASIAAPVRRSMSSDKTPIRIRGKRFGAKSEKWHSGKSRRHVRVRALIPTSSPPASPNGSVNSRPAKRRRLELSALEQLPTEMIQAIFVESGNLGLPSASSNLTAQLSGKQLQWELTCNALTPVVLAEENHASQAQLANATRLLNSRFMTWNAFRKWLNHACQIHNIEVSEPESSNGEWHSRYADMWRGLRPSAKLSLPSKVVRGPWTPDRISLLKVFSLYPDSCSTPLEGIVAEVAHDGLAKAAEEQSMEAMKLLRRLHVKPDQELLRKAVIDYGCHKHVVLYLLQWCLVELLRWNVDSVNITPINPRPEVDFLDPMLWAWTDKAKMVGEPKGSWLTDILKRLSSIVTNESTELIEELERDHELYATQWK